MKHEWKGQLQGGNPAEIESYEWVCYCDNCGVEQDDDNKDADCVFVPYDPEIFDECGGVRLDLIKPERETNELRSKYNELIMAVSRKFEGESRHQTALRYIQEAEQDDDNKDEECPSEALK